MGKKLLPIALLLIALLMIALPGMADETLAKRQAEVKINYFYLPNRPDNPYTENLIRLMKRDPGIIIKKWGGIALPGGSSVAPLMMSIVGKTAPDIGQTWFHLIRSQIRQGFLYPLNEWIGDDVNGNGYIDDDEAKWPGWKKIPKFWRQVATLDGKVYGVLKPEDSIIGVIFRTDLVKAAGLDPNKTPANWDEFYYWCQKLTDKGKVIPGAFVNRGQQGVALRPAGYLWLPWCQSAGGRPIVQIRKSLKTGKEYVFSMDEVNFVTPDGEDLSTEKSVWKADFASPECINATALYHKLMWGKWLVDPETGEPVNLSKKDISQSWTKVKERKIKFTAKDIISGVARMVGDTRGAGQMDLLRRGEACMTIGHAKDISKLSEKTGLDASLISWFPLPASPDKKGKRVVQIQNHYIVMYTGVGERPKAQRNQVWKAMLAINDKKIREFKVKQMILSGMSRFVPPNDLKMFGYQEYLKDVPKSIQRNFAEIASGKVKSFTEPFTGFWYTMDMALNRECLSLMLAKNGEDFDYVSALKGIQQKANSGIMFNVPKEELDKVRPYARIIMGLVVLLLAFLTYKLIRSKKQTKATSQSVYKGWIPIMLIFPALILIALWRYYPLLRGMIMAFQDYKVSGDSPFVGLDNFIVLAMDNSFWMSLLRTCYFVFLSLLFGFTAPIFLAILLTEVPKGKIFYRFLFFLPRLSSAMVIALLWKLMYDPSPAGFLNQVIVILNYLPFINIAPQQWLSDPNLAMFCCIIPGVWAGMGMGSLIYLAALQSVPKELYEAADVDGAGIWHKLIKITMPTLMPLMIINFVGVFIGSFQNMGNIFLLTFGGPGEATTVVSMKIWIEAYNNLRFSMATSMAWVLGSLLIGLTYFQIQFLGKVEYRKAKEN